MGIWEEQGGEGRERRQGREGRLVHIVGQEAERDRILKERLDVSCQQRIIAPWREAGLGRNGMGEADGTSTSTE